MKCISAILNVYNLLLFVVIVLRYKATKICVTYVVTQILECVKLSVLPHRDVYLISSIFSVSGDIYWFLLRKLGGNTIQIYV